MVAWKRKTDIGNMEIMELGCRYIRYEIINVKSVLGFDMQ